MLQWKVYIKLQSIIPLSYTQLPAEKKKLSILLRYYKKIFIKFCNNSHGNWELVLKLKKKKIISNKMRVFFRSCNIIKPSMQ